SLWFGRRRPGPIVLLLNILALHLAGLLLLLVLRVGLLRVHRLVGPVLFLLLLLHLRPGGGVDGCLRLLAAGHRITLSALLFRRTAALLSRQQFGLLLLDGGVA